VRCAPAVANPPRFPDLSRTSPIASELPNGDAPRASSSHGNSLGASPHLFPGTDPLPCIGSRSTPVTTHQTPHTSMHTRPPGQAPHLSSLLPASIPQPSPLQSNSSPRQFKHSIQAPQDYMHTRSKSRIFVPKKHFNLLASVHTSPLPRSYCSALKDPNWLHAMREEFHVLMNQHTWSLVPRPVGANMVTGKWIFWHKLHSNGSLSRYKARWVVHGFTQQQGIDFDETFSPVIKPSTIRVVLTIAVSNDWPIHQLDVKNAFLHGTLQETVYAQQPARFVSSTHPDYVCKLNKSLYGLKQAPRTWFLRFTSFLLKLGVSGSKSDTSLFVLHRGSFSAYLLLYVDDIILTANSQSLLQNLISQLRAEFDMSDLGPLHHFLGISVQCNKEGLILCQDQYASDILDRANMSNCNSCITPADTKSKPSVSDGVLLDNPIEYRSLAGALQYLTLTRPDICFAVQQVCSFMHAPTNVHMNLVKRILRYLKGTIHPGLHISRSSSSDLVIYSDADWAGCLDTRRSTSGFCAYFGGNLVSWSSK
jgi:hypothetical protein